MGRRVLAAVAALAAFGGRLTDYGISGRFGRQIIGKCPQVATEFNNSGKLFPKKAQRQRITAICGTIDAIFPCFPIDSRLEFQPQTPNPASLWPHRPLFRFTKTTICWWLTSLLESQRWEPKGNGPFVSGQIHQEKIRQTRQGVCRYRQSTGHDDKRCACAGPNQQVCIATDATVWWGTKQEVEVHWAQ